MRSRHQGEFIKGIRQLAQSRSVHEVFEEFNRVAALSIALPFHADVREALAAVHQRIDRSTLEKYDQLFTVVVEALEEDPRDFLGEVFGELELANKYQGQFFTPDAVSVMVTRMQLHGIKETVDRQGWVTISEPACGAGSMVIAARQVFIDEGLNPGRAALFTLTDVSELCFHMAYIQVSLLGLAAEVIHGNTLSMQVFKAFRTPVFFLEHWPFRMLIRQTSSQPEDPTIRPTEPQSQPPQQYTLFDFPHGCGPTEAPTD